MSTTNNSSNYSPVENLLQVGDVNGKLKNIAVGVPEQVLAQGAGPTFLPTFDYPSQKILWFQTSIPYKDQSFVFYTDTDRANAITLWKNNSGAEIPAGAFVQTQWQRIGSYDGSPWTFGPTNTGILSGGSLTPLLGTADLQVGAGEGIIVSGSLPSRTGTKISWSAVTITLPNFVTDSGYLICVDDTGTVVSLPKNSTDMSVASRSFILLGECLRSLTAPAQIGSAVQNAVQAFDTGDSFAEMMITFIKPQYIAGGFISPVPTTLSVSRTEGIVYGLGLNFEASPTSANRVTVLSENPVVFSYITQNDTLGTTNTTFLDNTNYDVAGVITTIPGTRASVHRLFYNFVDKKSYVAYGQKTYNNVDQARSSLIEDDSTFTLAPYLKNASVFVAYIVLLKTATDTNNPTQCYIQQATGTTLSGGSLISNTLEGLLDVNVTAKQIDQSLRWSGSTWTNQDQKKLFQWINQVNHGFTVGQLISEGSGTWILAKANNAGTLAVGFVSATNGPDFFQLCATGFVTWTAHGFTPGATLYLSKDTAGLMTATKVIDGLNYSQVIATVIDPNSLLINIGGGEISPPPGIKVYTTTANYSVGDYVFYDETIYRVTTAIVNAPVLPNFALLQTTTKELVNGSQNNAAGKPYQLSFGYGGSPTYRNYLRTRHDGGTQANNGFEFLTSDATQNGTIATAVPCFTMRGAKAYAGGWGAVYAAPADDMQVAPKKYVDDSVTTLAVRGGIAVGPSLGTTRLGFVNVIVAEDSRATVSGVVYKQYTTGGSQLAFIAYLGRNPGTSTLQTFGLRVLSYSDPQGFGAVGNTLYLYRLASQAMLAVDVANTAAVVRFQYDACPTATFNFNWAGTGGAILVASTTPTLLTYYNPDGSVNRSFGVNDPDPMSLGPPPIAIP